MNLHEYQAKQLFRDYQIPVSEGLVASSADIAEEKALSLNVDKWVVKAQIHSGARGKAGGIIVCDTPLAVAQATDKLIGKKLNSGTAAVHPIIGGIAPAAPPMTMFNEVVRLSQNV